MRKIVWALSLIGLNIALSSAFAGQADASRRHHHHHSGSASQSRPAPLDLSPIDVDPFVVPPATSPEEASFQKRMNLENGVQVKAAHWIEPAQVTSRDLFILQITQSLEGGFDSVNMYDKGVASWGIMQWSAHEGSLAQALIYIKRRLLATHQAGLWQQLFVANGMDVNGDGFLLYGEPVTDAASARLAFRGTAKVGNYDANLVNHWANVLARAGRQPAIQALQTEYASHIVEAVLQKRLDGIPYHYEGRDGVTASDLADNDPYTEALVFALWTNNPRHAQEYVEDAARSARSVSASDNPAYWEEGTFGDALLRLCLSSRFGNWQQRASMIEARAQAVHSAPAASLTPFEASYQTVIAARKARRFVELASRHKMEQRGVSPSMELNAIEQANAAASAYENHPQSREYAAPAEEKSAIAQAPEIGQSELPSAALAEGDRALRKVVDPSADQAASTIPSELAAL